MTYLRILLAYAVLALTSARDAIVAALLRLVPVSVDGAISSLNKVVAKLERAEARARATAQAEISAGLAAFGRAGEANAAASRAARVKDNLAELLA